MERKLINNITATLNIPKNLNKNSAVKIGNTEIDFDFEFTPQTTYRDNEEMDPLQKEIESKEKVIEELD